VGDKPVRLDLVRNQRARRYVLRVRSDGTARVTIPRGGSAAFAVQFADRNKAWIERQLERRQAEQQSALWADGTMILFRGESVRLQVEPQDGQFLIQFSDQSLFTSHGVTNLRREVETYLWSLAEKELIPRAHQLAAHYCLAFSHIRVRNQRSRWGSCSTKKTISLNWRLIQAPPIVRDYLILHELMHLREMNHSPRFWDLVESACPAYREAEKWLDEHAYLLCVLRT
jgi:predicted metal-dependent hydrolase